MPYNLFVILLTVSLASCYYQNEFWTDIRFVKQEQVINMTNVSDYCTKPGLQCGDCHTSILCRLIDGKYQGTIYETCMDPQTCDKGTCSDHPSISCVKYKYQCQMAEGVYPDPAFCQKYHYCVPKNGILEHTEGQCNEGYYYNILSTRCDMKLPPSKVCPVSSIPKCTTPGQSSALKENPSIYYTCWPVQPKILYPILDACQNGQKYYNYSCHY
ncbi:hypothetical protein RN001_013116 [Aquatica leii]|uniref:Chitin-binding type-2 domain-containing protein n=1 Tax=Aquatica leii TaxID=1421715 RepID=A0AAN7P3Y1_9COLE|nr:hypothetical protein RN001_013116 [Aquatica leii]